MPSQSIYLGQSSPRVSYLDPCPRQSHSRNTNAKGTKSRNTKAKWPQSRPSHEENGAQKPRVDSSICADAPIANLVASELGDPNSPSWSCWWSRLPKGTWGS